MNVNAIVKTWLKDNGYDGLLDDHGECGCELADLFPCDRAFDMCHPGYRGPDSSGEADWCMYASKEAAEAAKEVPG